MRSLSLRIKLLLLLTGLTVLPLSLVGYSLLITSSTEIKRRASDDLVQTASNLARLLDQTYADTWLAPLALARDTLDNGELTAQERAAILSGVTNLPDIVAVQLVGSASATETQLATRDSKRFHASSEDLLRALGTSWGTIESGVAGGQIYVSEARYNARWDFWSVLVALPLKHDGGRTALAARISLDGMRRHIAEQTAQHAGVVTLVDGRGVKLLDATLNAAGTGVFGDIRAALLDKQRHNGVRPYSRPSGEMMLAAYAPLHTMNWAVVAETTEATAYWRLRQVIDSLGLWLAASLGIALVGARIVSTRISGPIMEIVHATAEISNGKFDVHIEGAEMRSDEIGVLGQQINAMVAGLRERERIKDIFGRYQTVEVMQTLLGDPSKLALGGEMRTVTIMMTDLRGFTAAAGRLPPDQVLSMLNNYFEIMVTICGKHNGTIIEILGDALLVLFGAPMASADHALRGVACAVEMQNAMHIVNAINAKAGLPQLEMGIGLNTGDVVLGNIGSQKRAKYGVVGTHVNLASRIESYTVGGQVLVSQAVCEAAGSVVRVGNLRTVEAKGLSTPLTICEVTGIGGTYDMQLATAHETMQSIAIAMPMVFGVIEGKDMAKSTLHGKITKLSAHRAVLEVSQVLTPLMNLRMNSTLSNLAGMDVYAKVLEADVQTPNSYLIHFTSVPKDVQAHLNGLLSGERPVAHFKPPPVTPKRVPMTLIAPAKVDR